MAKSHFVGHVVYFAHREPRLSCSTFLAAIVCDEWIMNQPDVVLFEKIALFTSSQSTGMSTCNDCKFCGKHFKRLESHLSQNWHVNCITCLVVSMQQQQWHPTSQMTAAM